MDNYLGSYFLTTNRDFAVYTGGEISQIYVIRKRDYHSYSLAECFIDFLCVVVGILSAIPIFNSINFKKKPESLPNEAI